MFEVVRTLSCAVVLAAGVACSSTESPAATLTLAPTYHLRSIDGVPLPIDSNGEIADSGHFVRLHGDTVRTDRFSHVPPSRGNPGLGVIAVGTWRASQSGNVVIMFSLIAFATDTAFLHGDTLTLHTHDSRVLQVEVYVAP